MKTWFFRVLLLAVLGLAGWGLWHWLFPNPQQAIRKRLGELAHAASFPANEGPLAQAMNAQKLTTFFTTDAQITVDVPGQGRHTLTGQDELLHAAMGARSLTSSLQVQFLDINVDLGSGKSSAMVNLTAKGRTPGNADFFVEELKLGLKYLNGRWLVHRVETVKPLRE